MKLNVIDSGREFELFVVQYLYTVIINFQTKLKRKQEGYTSLLKKLRNVLFFSNTGREKFVLFKRWALQSNKRNRFRWH